MKKRGRKADKVGAYMKVFVYDRRTNKRIYKYEDITTITSLPELRKVILYDQHLNSETISTLDFKITIYQN